MKQKNGFSGQLGFVFAAAGSAVGVGNLWRFPYLAAKDGGGLFLIIYLILVFTVGFTLLTTDIAIGRKTGKKCNLRISGNEKEMEIFRYFNLLCTSIDHDLLFGYRWMDFEIYHHLSDRFRKRSGRK